MHGCDVSPACSSLFVLHSKVQGLKSNPSSPVHLSLCPLIYMSQAVVLIPLCLATDGATVQCFNIQRELYFADCYVGPKGNVVNKNTHLQIYHTESERT